MRRSNSRAADGQVAVFRKGIVVVWAFIRFPGQSFSDRSSVANGSGAAGEDDPGQRRS